MRDIIIESHIKKPFKGVLKQGEKRQVYKNKIIDAFVKMKVGDSFALICTSACAYALGRLYQQNVNKSFSFSIIYMDEDDNYRLFKNKDKK